MAQLIQPNNVKVVTKDGEIIVSLQIDLNINLNQSGSVSAIQAADSVTTNNISKKDDDVAWVIPDFKPTEKIKFGK